LQLLLEAELDHCSHYFSEIPTKSYLRAFVKTPENAVHRYLEQFEALHQQLDHQFYIKIKVIALKDDPELLSACSRNDSP